MIREDKLSFNQTCSDSPGDLLIAPLWSIGTSVLQGFEHQQVALSVAEQQVCISSTGRIQETLNSLEVRQAIVCIN